MVNALDDSRTAPDSHPGTDDILLLQFSGSKISNDTYELHAKPDAASIKVERYQNVIVDGHEQIHPTIELGSNIQILGPCFTGCVQLPCLRLCKS